MELIEKSLGGDRNEELDNNPAQRLWWHVIIRAVKDAIGDTYPEHMSHMPKRAKQARTQREAQEYVWSRDFDVLVDESGFPHTGEELREMVRSVSDFIFVEGKKGGNRKKEDYTVQFGDNEWTVREIANYAGLPLGTINGRIRRGWSTPSLFMDK